MGVGTVIGLRGEGGGFNSSIGVLGNWVEFEGGFLSRGGLERIFSQQHQHHPPNPMELNGGFLVGGFLGFEGGGGLGVSFYLVNHLILKPLFPFPFMGCVED